MVCWCDTFFSGSSFAVYFKGLLVLVLLPSESLFFVTAAAAASAVAAVLSRFFVEVLVIGVL